MNRRKAKQCKGREKKKIKRKSQKKEDTNTRKGQKIIKCCIFPIIWDSGGSKSSLAKAAGAEPAGQIRNKKYMSLWSKIHL